MKILNVGVSFVIVAAVVLAAPTLTFADTISINTLLKNASFESGATSTCPTDWSCVNLVGVNQPTAGQYPDPNGLSAGTAVPDGQFAAFTPLSPNSNGTLRQTISGQQYLAGNSYELTFWLGNPLGGLFPSRVDVQLLAGAFNSSQTNTLCDTGGRNSTLVSGAQSAVDNGVQCAFSITGPDSGPAGVWQPADGDWRLYTLAFSTNANISGDIGVQFNIFGQQSAGNGTLMHLDLSAPRATQTGLAAVPEPATLTMLGLGLASVGARLRARRRQAS